MRGIAGEPAELLINAQHSAIAIDLDYTCADMLVGGCKPLIAGKQPMFRAHA